MVHLKVVIGVAVLATIPLGACRPRQQHTEWWIGAVEVNGRECRAITGNQAVLEFYDFGCSFPLPVCGGRRVFLITSPGQLTPGTPIELPNPAIRGIHCSLGEGHQVTELDLAGTVRVLEARGLDRRLKLDVHATNSDWRERRTLWFVRQGKPAQ